VEYKGLTSIGGVQFSAYWIASQDANPKRDVTLEDNELNFPYTSTIGRLTLAAISSKFASEFVSCSDMKSNLLNLVDWIALLISS
jgi:hypothetical protein